MNVNELNNPVLLRVLRTFSTGMRAIWQAFNDDRLAKFIFPQKTIFVALDKDSLSMVYATGFLGRNRMIAHRQYGYEWKPGNNISRKYIYRDGQLPRPEILASTLEMFISEVNAEGAGIVLCVPKAWTVYRMVDFPAVVKENLSNVVACELDRLASLQPENAYYGYRVVGQTQDSLTCAIVAVNAGLVDSYLNLLKSKGLIVERVVTSLSVMGHLLKHLYGGRAFILADVGADSCELAGIDGNTVLFAHSENISQTGALSKITAMADELNLLARDWPIAGSPPRMVLAGEPSVVTALAEHLDMHVHVLNKSDISLDLPGDVKKVDAMSAAGSFEMISGHHNKGFNLLSKKKEDVARQAYLVSALLSVLLLVIGLIILTSPLLVEMHRISEIESRIDARREEYRRIEPQKNELDEILYAIKSVNEFKNSAPPMILLIKDLTDRLPDAFWISRMAVTGNNMNIEMQVQSAPADVVSLLEASPYIKNVRRVESSRDSGQPDEEASGVRLMMEIDNTPVREEKDRSDVEEQ
ncbi:MAG: hypothetical protein R6W75_05455 [Smithellaceae bacterium]